jgi:hypothetical protein
MCQAPLSGCAMRRHRGKQPPPWRPRDSDDEELDALLRVADNLAQTTMPSDAIHDSCLGLDAKRPRTAAMAAPERVVPGPSRGFVQSDKATPPVLAQLNASSPLAAHMQPGTDPQTSTYPREHAYQSNVSSASTSCTLAAPQVIMWNRATVPLSAAPNGSSPSTGHMHTWPEPQRVQKQTSGSSPSAGQGLGLARAATNPRAGLCTTICQSVWFQPSDWGACECRQPSAR